MKDPPRRSGGTAAEGKMLQSRNFFIRKNKIMDNRLKNRMQMMAVVLLMMYVNAPFYIRSMETVHKMLYYAFAVGPPCVVLCKKYGGGRKYCDKTVFLAGICWVVYFITGAVLIPVTHTSDFEFAVSLGRSLLGIFAMYSVCHIWEGLYRKGTIRHNIMDIYIYAAACYAAGTVLFLIVPGLRQAWTGFIADYGGMEYAVRSEYRTRFGFAGFSNFSVSYFIAMAFVCYLCNYCIMKQGKASRSGRLCSQLFLLAGSLFYGRVGAVAVIVLTLVYSLYSFFVRGDRSQLVCALMAGFLLLPVLVIAGGMQADSVAGSPSGWVFEPLIHLMQRKGFRTESSDAVLGFYKNFHPDIRILLWGTGEWSWYKSDVGFMKHIYYGGLAYTIALYGLVMFAMAIVLRKVRSSGQNHMALTGMLFMISFIIFELKGEVTLAFIKAMIPLYIGVAQKSVNPDRAHSSVSAGRKAAYE